MSGSPRATVVKIGGSTLGSQDTSLQDVVAMHAAGRRPVVVHGGGAMISDWLRRLEIPSTFVDGLRSTNAEALDVVVGVLRGVVNAQLVSEIVALGGRAVGLCGV
ncbi:MAG: acetylglutamate kinase, partial [Dehalococcoidia bacterium]